MQNARKNKVIKSFLGDRWVLIVDPSTNMRDSVRRFLQNLGIKNVKLLSTAAEAKRELLSIPVGLFIVEWILPDQNGLEFCREIRKKKKYSNAPFLLLSGENLRSDIMLASEAGVSRYLLKPFAYDEFCDQVAELIEQSANPSRISGLIQEAELSLTRHETKKAEESFTQALSEKADSARALTGMGRIRLSEKDVVKAIEYFEQAILANASYLEAYGLLLDAYVLNEQKDKQLQVAEKAHELSPDNPRYTLMLARMYLDNGDQVERAEQYFKMTIKLSPKLGEAYRGLGNVQFIKGDYDKAIKTYKKALDLLPADISLVNALGLSYVKKGHLDKGIEYYRMGLNIDSSDWRLLFNMGYAHEKRNEIAQAISFYQRTLDANPGLEKAQRRLTALKEELAAKKKIPSAS